MATSAPATFDDVRTHSGTEQGLCVAAVTRADGSIHASVVNAGPMRHPVNGRDVVAFVVRSDAVKLRRTMTVGRASLTFRRGWRWVGIEGPTDVIGPDHDVPGVRLPNLLQDVFRAAGGNHDDWDEFDQVMADEGRAAVFVEPERIIGQP